VKITGVGAVVLTYGHLDHNGRLLLPAQRGHTLPAYAAPALEGKIRSANADGL
jgi:mRNA degradation ribonuclease J1/J2